jgi:hypothetical protein
MAEFPAPNDPAIGVPRKPWADAEADIPTIMVSARASLLEALNMNTPFSSGRMRRVKLNLERVAAGTTKLHFMKRDHLMAKRPNVFRHADRT